MGALPSVARPFFDDGPDGVIANAADEVAIEFGLAPWDADDEMLVKSAIHSLILERLRVEVPISVHDFALVLPFVVLADDAIPDTPRRNADRVANVQLRVVFSSSGVVGQIKLPS